MASSRDIASPSDQAAATICVPSVLRAESKRCSTMERHSGSSARPCAASSSAEPALSERTACSCNPWQRTYGRTFGDNHPSLVVADIGFVLDGSFALDKFVGLIVILMMLSYLPRPRTRAYFCSTPRVA